MTKQTDMISFHRRLLRDGLTLSWKHKHLWILGFFAAFAGLGGAYEPLFRVYDQSLGMVPSGSELIGPGLVPGISLLRYLMVNSANPMLSMVVFALVGLLVAAVSAFVVVMALGATVSSVKALHGGKDLAFMDAVRKASGEFWRLLGVFVVVKAISLTALTLIGLNLINFRFSGNFITGLFFFLGFMAFAAIAVVVALVGMYSIMAVIDSRITVREAIRRGWTAFVRHWLVSLEAGALILLTQLCLIVIAVGAVAILMLPLILFMLIALYLDWVGMGVIIATLAAIIVVLAMCLMAAYLTVFQLSVWWQLWTEFGKQHLLSGLERWVGPILEKFKVGKFKV